MIGIYVNDNGEKRILQFNGKNIIDGGNINRYGIYETKDGLFFDGKLIAKSQETKKGIYILNDKVMYGNDEISIGTEPPVESKYWIPPQQEASVYKPWDYNGLINEYDKLMAISNGYITKYRYEIDSVPVLTKNGDFELFHYVLEPKSYSKTIFIQAGIHGNEMDAKQQLLRLVDILVNRTEEKEYERFKPIRDDVRLIIIPCVSPYGHETSSMNIPYIYEDEEIQYGINPNRNYDFNQQWALESVGVGGYPAFDIAEVQHTKYVIEKYGVENFNYAMDWHDGGNVNQHYWINYPVDGENRELINDFISYLIERHEIENAIIPNCKDTSTTGIASMYFAKSLGILGSTVEWIGGYLGYDFGTSQMTQSMEIRGNMLLMAYENDIKGWRVNEPENAQYFHFDYPKAFTKEGMRYDGSESRTIVTDEQIYNRWDELQNKYPNKIIKSKVLGQNPYGQNIFTYTFGNGYNKVLYVGGIMRYSAPHKIDEFAIYQLIEYLCNDYIVEQSKFLKELRDNYKIIVLPYIDNKAANNATDRNSGLNNMALSYKKWQIIENICQPTSYALQQHDVPILKKIIDENQDLKCIVSGGEDCSKYAGNSQDYTTDFETHIVIPKNQENFVEEYVKHLEMDRNEFVVLENTVGATFGDYAFDNFGIPTYFVQLNVSKKFEELANYHTLDEKEYLHSNYEAGRRMANIVNLFLL